MIVSADASVYSGVFCATIAVRASHAHAVSNVFCQTVPGDCVKPVPNKQGRAVGCAECIFNNASLAGDNASSMLCQQAASQKLTSRETLFREGDAANTVYTVRSGQLKMVTVDTTGREHVLGIFGPGELLGLDTLEEGVHNASGIALRPAEVCGMSKAEMLEALRGSQLLGKYMTQRLIAQLREARSLQVCLGTVRSTAKVAAWLARHGKLCEDGQYCVAKNITLSDLAGVVGLAQETACRALGELERDGCIRSESKRWVILDREGLSQAGKVQSRPLRR